MSEITSMSIIILMISQLTTQLGLSLILLSTMSDSIDACYSVFRIFHSLCQESTYWCALQFLSPVLASRDILLDLQLQKIKP